LRRSIRALLIPAAALACPMHPLNPASAGVVTTGSTDPVINSLGDFNTATGVTIGVSAPGTLLIDNASTLSSATGLIASDPAGTTGAVTIGDSSQWTMTGGLDLGYGNMGTLEVASTGSLSADSLRIGTLAAGEGHLNLLTAASTGPVIIFNHGVTVGDNGKGYIDAGQGSFLVSESAVLAATGSTSFGQATFSGLGTAWSITNGLTVGQQGEGTLTVSSAAQVSAGSVMIAASTATAKGTVALDGGSTLDSGGDVVVGVAGTGFLNITGMGSAVSGNNIEIGRTGSGTATLATGGSALANAGLMLATEMGSHGSLSIAGAGSTFTVTTDLQAGIKGAADITISPGGSLSNRASAIGVQSNSSGTVSVTGPSAAWDNSSFAVVGASGTGALNVSAGGTVTSNGGTVGDNAGGIGTVMLTGAGSSWTSSSDITLGSSGKATVTVQSGAQLVDAVGLMGELATGDGTLTVKNPGSKWLNGDFIEIGRSGKGDLHIEDGGVVTSTNAANMAVFAGSKATVIVTGPASKWDNAAYLNVGNLGQATLTVSDGAVVKNTSASAGIEASSVANITVTGTNSAWNNSSFLTLGVRGKATLNITAGGIVTNTSGGAASEQGSTGAITLNGGTWTNSSFLVVADKGTVTLNATAGSHITATSVDFALGATGNATATLVGDLLVGAALQSTLNASSFIVVGRAGQATLNVREGSLVSNPNDLATLGSTAGSIGKVNLETSSIWNSGKQFVVGGSGRGELTISGGGLLDSKKADSGTGSSGVLASQANSVGIATITGAGSRWTNDGTVNVGFRGQGTLNVQAGGKLEAAHVIIARTTTANGTATFTGAGTVGNVSGNFTVGGDPTTATPTPGGPGGLSVLDQSALTAAGTLRAFPAGTVTVNNATLTAGPFANDGTYAQTTGIANVKEIEGVGLLSVTGGALTADRVRQNSLAIGNSGADAGIVRIRPNGTSAGTSVLSTLNFAGATDAWQGKLDLADNDLILKATAATQTAALAATTNRVKTARNTPGTLWQGQGITTSAATAVTGLAVIPNRDSTGAPLYTTFDGVSVDANTILVKYTYDGDANADGKINIDDYTAIDLGLANGLTGYNHGDFNYSGGVPDGDDYNLIDIAFFAQGAPLAGSAAAPLTASASAVPEPSALSLLAMSAGTILRRRRR
jgi:T5SS/PEP-CTERM-associated repeat protein